ncbi:MAG: hypothetical protein AMXMBFR59_16650 [Rhodanobacteraceae bacterium]
MRPRDIDRVGKVLAEVSENSDFSGDLGAAELFSPTQAHEPWNPLPWGRPKQETQMTAANLAVFPYDDIAEMGPDPKVIHLDCGHVRGMAFRQNPIDGRVSWICECGLTIQYDRFGEASRAMSFVAIDGQPRELPAGSYWSNTATVVSLRSP